MRKKLNIQKIVLVGFFVSSCGPKHTILDVVVKDECPVAIGQNFTVMTRNDARALLGEHRGGATVKKDEFETTLEYEERMLQHSKAKLALLAEPRVFLLQENYPLGYDADDESFEIHWYRKGSVYGRHESLGVKKSHLAFYAMDPLISKGLGYQIVNPNPDDDFLVYDKSRQIKGLQPFADKKNWDKMIKSQERPGDYSGFEIKLHASAEEARKIKHSLRYYVSATPRPPFTDNALRTKKYKPTVLFADIHCSFFSIDGKTVTKIFGALEEPSK